MCDTHNEILFSIKREGHPDIVTVWLNLEGIMLNEMSDTERYALTYTWDLKVLELTEVNQNTGFQGLVSGGNGEILVKTFVK